MSLPRVILVPTDFSAIADRASAVARELAAAIGARIVLVHVVRFTDYAVGEGVYAALDALREDVLKTVGTDIEARARAAREAGVTCETRIAEGVPAPEIITVARDVGADLVVMGTHGRTGVGRILLGSVAQRVVADASRPVLLVPALERPAR